MKSSWNSRNPCRQCLECVCEYCCRATHDERTVAKWCFQQTITVTCVVTFRHLFSLNLL